MNPIRFLLVQPSSGSKATSAATLAGSEHLGLAYLASALALHGYSSEIVDLEAVPMKSPDFVALVVSGQYDVVGFSPTAKSVPNALLLMHDLKMQNPDVVTLWGGHLATGMGSEVFAHVGDLDAVVVGQAERVIPLIALALERGKVLPQHPQILINHAGRVTDTLVLENVETPSWYDLLPTRRLPAKHYSEVGARIVTSLGCRYSCSFCTSPYFYGRRTIWRRLDHVFQEIDFLVNQLGVKRLWLNDDLFIDGSPLSRARAREFARRLSQQYEDIRFRPMCRADTFQTDRALLDELALAGMDTIFVGFDSGDDRALREIGKRTTSEAGRWIASVLNDRGVILQPGFMMFTPGATTDTLFLNVGFLDAIGELYRLFPLTRTAMAFPKTELWGQMQVSYDEERSTPYVRYPRFKSAVVRQLSIAFERLEEHFAETDGALYRLRATGRLDMSARRAAGAFLRQLFSNAVQLAQEGADADRIEHFVLRYRPELEKWLSCPNCLAGRRSDGPVVNLNE